MIEYPPSWEVMPKDSSGKEVACHVVDLQPSDPEYQEVLTASEKVKVLRLGPLDGRIIGIQRIQNPNLYVQYAGRKEKIDKQNPNIRTERWLFCDCEESEILRIFFIKDLTRASLVPVVSVMYIANVPIGMNFSYIQLQCLVEEYPLVWNLEMIHSMNSLCFMLVS